MRTMIECFFPQDDHATVSDQEKLKNIPGYVQLVCQGMRPEVETV